MLKRYVLGFVAIIMMAGGVLVWHGIARAAGEWHYVDCTAGSPGDGSMAAPWNSLTAVNAAALGPGDRVLFRRGTRCTGTFAPSGSGTAGAPIVAGAYGTGPKPALDGNGAPDA